MTKAAAEERKGIQRLQNVLVVLLLLVLSAVAARIMLVNEPQEWREAELDIAVSRFIDSIWLARTEWMRRGKPTEVLLLTESQNQEIPVLMNEYGWPSVEQGCFQLWQQLGSEIPARAVQVEAETDSCRYQVKQHLWFVYNSRKGTVVQE